ncbi:MAG: hypothetical protein JST68_30640 [Bacteroidetes bacterium]|nr:hypothetical protein [Bacteroidota bacterium]
MKQGSSRRRFLGLWIGISIAVILFGVWFFIRTYVVAAYNVPTGAMEKTIPVKSKVLVSRMGYLPIKRGDIVVFHFPAGDTVINLPDYQSMRPYYDVLRELGRGNVDSGRQIVLADPENYPLDIRPVNKRENYLKRCIGVAGDTLEMRDEIVYINGREHAWPSEAETYFHVVTNGQPLDEANIKARYGVDITNAEEVRPAGAGNTTEFEMLLTWKAREKMLKDGFAREISTEIDDSSYGVFPYDGGHRWTRDNYGPLWVPKAGASMQLTALNYPIYERIIRTYEGNKLEMRDGKIYLNGREETKYTFKMNYYWVIGDNLHGSQDSRYWGFVPEDHLIGKVSSIL